MKVTTPHRPGLDVGWFARMLVWATRHCSDQPRILSKARSGQCAAEGESPASLPRP